jgi:peptidyl-prolyl cis-trans isomerase SurA
MCLLAGFGPVRADTLDRIVAVVNGDIILYSELQDQVRVLAKISPDLKTDDPSKRAQIEREILQQMIRDRLADEEIRRLKIAVSSRDVDEAIEGIKQENRFTDAQLDYMIQQQGQTRAQFRDGIKKEIQRSRLVDRVLKSKTIITQEQVDAYLNTDQASFIERRRLAIIFIPYPEGADARKTEEIDKLGQDVMARLRGGADFSKVAREHSKGPAAQEGGDLGYIATSELAPPIEAATRGLKPNEMTDLIKTPAGYFILKVLDIQKEKQASVDPNAREKARRQLLQIEMNRKFQDWVQELESRAFIQISL